MLLLFCNLSVIYLRCVLRAYAPEASCAACEDRDDIHTIHLFSAISVVGNNCVLVDAHVHEWSLAVRPAGVATLSVHSGGHTRNVEAIHPPARTECCKWHIEASACSNEEHQRKKKRSAHC